MSTTAVADPPSGSEQSYSDILYDVSAAVARITINRANRLNAFNGDTIDQLRDAVARAAADRTVGVIVLTGAGEKSFSAGGDVQWEVEGGLEGHDWQLGAEIVACPKPVLARVRGYAIGGGNHLAYFCDFTIASDDSVFGQNGPRVGSPAGGYVVSHLASIIGHKRAREMWMLCRRYTAQQMLDWGLINAVVPASELDAEVDRWCSELLALSPGALRTVKASFRDHMLPYMGRNVSDVVRAEAPGFFESGEQQEGAAAFLEKRTPDFSRFR
jgi:2-ketocyclohexanecarboxyl-CoA hydrolase